LVAAVGAAMVVDYAPSRQSFSEGMPLARARDTAALVAGLPGEGGTVRIALALGYSPLSSWMLAQSRAGHASGWLTWQAGEHWLDSFVTAAYGAGLARPDSGEWNARYAPLLQAARVRYYLLDEELDGPPPAPWKRMRGNGSFALWEQPDVSAFATGYRAWSVWSGAHDTREPTAAADALRANSLLVAAPDDPAIADVLRRDADRARTSAPGEPIFALAYRRPEPERIELELDAGEGPALAFVSEGYHPWWRARVDERPAPVLRASIAHMAVPVGPGRHAVVLQLVRPVLVAAADGITAAAWIALALGTPIAWFARRSARRG
ncbi:MAG TPA: hypothetical protein VKH41_01155, partial [Myxococcota bacterium]|nr:hypothetical protein [Myxococcota bacterium]